MQRLTRRVSVISMMNHRRKNESQNRSYSVRHQCGLWTTVYAQNLFSQLISCLNGSFRLNETKPAYKKPINQSNQSINRSIDQFIDIWQPEGWITSSSSTFAAAAAAAGERTCITKAVDDDSVESHWWLDDLEFVAAAAFSRRLRHEQHIGEQHATNVQLKHTYRKSATRSARNGSTRVPATQTRQIDR